MAENPRNRSDHAPKSEPGEGTVTSHRAPRHTAISRSARAMPTSPPTYRWECHCRMPHVLLATYNAAGRLNIKVRDRYWHLYGFGQVHAVCPRCAAEHILDLRDVHDHDAGEFGSEDAAPGERSMDR